MDVTRLLIALVVGMAVLIVLIMKTKLHPALSLVISAVVVGIVGGVGLTAIPGLITSGFGNTLAKGVREAVSQKGLLGAFTGGFTSAAGGICAAIFFGYLVALVFRPGDKNK